MNRERVERWIELAAELPKRKYRLRDGGCFCVLGVGCEAYRRETGDGEWMLGAGVGSFFCSEGFFTHIMPDSVRKWFGITQEQHSLLLNTSDGTSKPMPQIIREVLLGEEATK